MKSPRDNGPLRGIDLRDFDMFDNPSTKMRLSQDVRSETKKSDEQPAPESLDTPSVDDT